VSDLEKIALLSVAVPLLLLGIVGMARGYHLSLRVFKPRRKDNDDGQR
jgi:hypothetical protein